MSDDQTSALKKLAVRVDALRRAMDSTTPDHGKWYSFRSYAQAYNALANEYLKLGGSRTISLFNLDHAKSPGNTVWPVQKQIFDTVYAFTLQLSALLSEYDVGISASISEIQDLLVANLRRAMFTRPESENDVKNTIESLLIGRGYQKPMDYDRESGKIKFSGREFIPDFVFGTYSLALEVKLIKTRVQVSSCIEEMSADIPAYLSTYQHLLFCVYDFGEIRDVNEFQNGLQKQAGVRVCVIKH